MAKLHPAFMPCIALAAALAAAGCTKLNARTDPPPPPLDVPAPPPRVVETAATERPTAGTLVEAPTSGAPSSRRPPPRVETPKPEPPKPAETTAPPAEATPPPEPARPATTLQTTPPEREIVLEREIRAKLDRANKDLSRIDSRSLSPEAKSQYDQARRFAAQAEVAIREKNLVFAQRLAGNAADMAAQLANR